MALAIRPVSGSVTVSSNSAWPMPPTVPPMIWLRASFSLRIRPPSTTETIRATRSRPRSRVDADLDELGREGAGRAPRWPAGGRRRARAVGGQLGQAVPARMSAYARRPRLSRGGCGRPAPRPRRLRARSGEAVVGDQVEEALQQRRQAAWTALPSAAVRPEPPAGGAHGMVGVAELDADLVELQSEQLGGELLHDRVGAGADVGARRCARTAVPSQSIVARAWQRTCTQPSVTPAMP